MLSEVELLDEALKAECLFDGVEVRALEVFDQGECEHGLVVEFAYLGWDFGPSQAGNGAQPSLSGDDFVEAIADWA
jgi:hypothetical protein